MLIFANAARERTERYYDHGLPHIGVVHYEQLLDSISPTTRAPIYYATYVMGDSSLAPVNTHLNKRILMNIGNRQMALIRESYNDFQSERLLWHSVFGEKSDSSGSQSPFRRNALFTFPISTDRSSGLAVDAFNIGTPFVNCEIQFASREYAGQPFMLHEGVKIQLAVLHLGPGEELGMEQHTEGEQVLYVLSGNVVVHTKNCSDARNPTDMLYYCTPGHAMVIPRGVPHNIINCSSTQSVQAWHFYAPRVHPGSGGSTYALTYRVDRNPAPEFKLEYEHTPEGRNSLREYEQHFPLFLLAMRAQTNATLYHQSEEVAIDIILVKPNDVCVLSREGYYYVIGGEGEIYNCDENDRPLNNSNFGATRRVSSRSLGDQQRTFNQLSAGCLFYVADQSAAIVLTTNQTATLRLMCIVYPEPNYGFFQSPAWMWDTCLNDEAKMKIYTTAKKQAVGMDRQRKSEDSQTKYAKELLYTTPVLKNFIREYDLCAIAAEMDRRYGEPDSIA